jgi:hypothetical protein
MRRYDDKGNRFNRAKDIAVRLLKQFNTEDQVFIIPVSTPETVLTTIEEVEQQSTAYTVGAWDFAFRAAAEIIREHPNFNKEVFIISDFQFRDPGISDFIAGLSDTRFYLYKVGDLPVNDIGIDTLIITNQIFEPNQPIKLDAGLKHSEHLEVQQTDIHLYVENQRVFHQRVTLTGNQRELIPLSFLPRHSGIMNGYLEISDDDLLADNKYYFTIEIPEKLNILFVDDSPSPFIKAALKSLSEKSNVSVTKETFSTWTRQSFQQYDLIWLANFPLLSNQIIPRLISFLESGRSLLLMPGTRTTPTEFNKNLAALNYQIKIRELHQTENQNNFFSIKTPDLNHPLFYELFRTDDLQFSKPKFFRFFSISSKTDTDFLLTFQNGEPYLLEDDTNSGSLFVFCGYIDDEWTDLQYRGLFIPLLSRLMHFGQSKKIRHISSLKVAEKKTISIFHPFDDRRFYLELPDAEMQTITPTRIGQEYQFALNQLSQPGIYQIKTAEKKVTFAIAVNCQINYLFEPYINLREIAGSLKSIRIFSEGDSFESEIVKARFGTELWKIFILFALIFLGLELMIIRLMQGRQ